MKDRLGNPKWIIGDLIDTSDDGIGVAITTQLARGAAVLIRGKLAGYPPDTPVRAEVKWCTEAQTGSYRAGLTFAPASEPKSDSRAKADAPAAASDEQDYYEIMQLSPNAEAETISRVYRILAQRYHPDNLETGNAELFLHLSDAHRILCDPELRAHYDARNQQRKQLRWRIFDQEQVEASPDDEQRKRQGVLSLLYAKALHDPENSFMTVFEFEELLGCPREHLQAGLWYLRGKGYIHRADNGRYAITVEGFDEVERMPRNRAPANRQLEGASNA